MVREVLKETEGWRDIQGFVTSSKHCRAHEADGLNEVARRVFACVEEAAVNEAAAKEAHIPRGFLDGVTPGGGERHGLALLPFVR